MVTDLLPRRAPAGALSGYGTWIPAPSRGRPDPTFAAIRGSDVIFDGVDGIAVVDAATGTPRWRVERSGELPGGDGARLADGVNLEPGRFWRLPLVDIDGSWAVVVGYVIDAADTSMDPEYGIAALAAADGHMVWKRPVRVAGPPTVGHSTNWVDTVLTDGHTVFVTAFMGSMERISMERMPDADRLRATKLLAVDGRTGEALWEDMGVSPLAIADDVVAGFGPGTTAANADIPETVGVLLDKATGEPLPYRFDRHPWVRPVEAAGNVAVLLAGTDDDRSVVGDLVLVDLADGSELAVLGSGGRGGAGTCDSDGALIACAVEDTSTDEMHLATYDTASGSGAFAAAGEWHELTIHAVWHDGVLSTMGVGNQSTQVLDLAGKVVQDLPGYFMAASDEFVVMRSVSVSTDYAVYRVTG